MICLSYQFSPEWNAKIDQLNLAQADEVTLRYKAFLGDQIFVVDEADFSARWEWVPLLDFAACLYAIVEKLKGGEKALVFEFTESDAQIQFNKQGDKVLITSNYRNAKSTVLLGELNAAVYSYTKQILQDAMDFSPELKANNSLRTWYPLIQ